MNRDTHSDVLNQTTHSALGLKTTVKTYGQLRHPNDRHNEPTTYPEIPERDGAVNSTTHIDISYLDSFGGSHWQEGHGRSAENQTQVVRSEHPMGLTRFRTLPSNRDLRRNLYVLGLPFDLAKSDFTKIFETYGTVTHAVILATLDSASRRRGFIVMSTHQEAKAAMDALSRTQIKGHMLDVSWAVVQRSQGFLDGADRTMMLANSTPSMSEPDGPCSNPTGSEGQIDNHWALTHIPTSKLLVSNLSTVFFTQVSDLHPLFYPFGPIKDLRILGSSPVGPLDTTVAAMVEYVNDSSAQEAKDALRFQSYAGHAIEAHYICDIGTPTHTMSSPFLSGSLSGHGKPSDFGLNPFAIPFSIGSHFSTGGQIYNSRYRTEIPSGLPSDALLAPQPFPAHMRPYITDAPSRSSSTTSSTWSHDGRPLGPSRTSHSSLRRASTYTSYA